MKTVRQIYDILIIGAGPAGLNAGLHAINQSSDLSILLIDKKIPWEKPMPCAEGVGRLGFEESITINPSWIRQEVSKATFHSPDGSQIAYTDNNKGYIIDRARMQSDLAKDLASKNVECRYDIQVKHVSKIDQGTRTVVFDNGDTVKAKVIIDASGPLSALGKEEKISWKPQDLEPAYFAHVTNIEIPSDTVHLYVGQKLAPGGYAWVFPRGNNAANIGVLVGNGYRGSANIRMLLENFLKDQFPKVNVLQRFAGGIPCGYQRGTVALQGLIKAGDAASTINPISRAGIVEALISGELAGKHAIGMLGAQNEREIKKICHNYETAWYKKRGCQHLKLARVKSSMNSIPDEDYNKAAHSLSSIPQNELTMSRIFRVSLGRFPRLVWALRHLM